MAAAAHNGQIALAYPVDSLAIDGNFADWPAHILAQPIALVEYGIRPDDTRDFRAQFRAAYSENENALYLAVEVEDQSIVVDLTSESNWGDQWDKQDGCELYLTLDHADSDSPVLQYALWGNARVGHDSGGSTLPWDPIELAVRRTGDRHYYEWRIDIEHLSTDRLAQPPNRILGFDLAIGDKDSDGSSFSWMVWGRGVRKFARGERHGDLLMADKTQSAGQLVAKVQWQGEETGASHARIHLRRQGDAPVDLYALTDQAGHFTTALPAGSYAARLIRPEPGHPDSSLLQIAPEQTATLALSAALPTGTARPVGQGRSLRAGTGYRQGVWHVFGVEDGLISTTVTDLLQDRRGRFWIANFARGLTRYDGYYFTHFNAEDGLPSDWTNCLLEDRQNRLWIGTRAGLVRYDGRTFTTFTTQDGLLDDHISRLLEDRQGRLWIASQESGISRYDGHTFTNFTPQEGLPSRRVTDLLEDRDGKIWIATLEGGLTVYDGESFSYLGARDGLGHDSVCAMLEDAQGTLWFGTCRTIGISHGLARYDGKRFTRYSSEQGLPDSVVVDLLEDGEGKIWISTRAGLVRYDGERFTTFTSEDGLPPYWINALTQDRQGLNTLTQDRQGNLWVGTGGIARYQGNSFANFTSADGLPHDVITDLLEDSLGQIWVGTRQGLGRYNGDSFKHFTSADGLAWDWITALAQDRQGNLWIGMFGSGICRYDGERFTCFTSADGLVGDYIWALYVDRRGDLWIGTGPGVSRYDGEHFTNFTRDHGLVHDGVHAITEDQHGHLWFGTRGGASRYNGETFTNFTAEDGLLDNWVSAIAEDRRGRLWFGTMKGLSRYNGEKGQASPADSLDLHPLFTNFTSEDGLAHGGVDAIVEDRRGHLWFGTGNGISRYDGLVFQNLTQRDGLASSAVSRIIEDLSGDFWMATNNGLTRYRANDIPPPIRLLDVLTDQRHGPVASIDLPSTQSYLAFEYQGTDFGMAPEQIAYAFQLEGYDAGWRWTRDKQVEYTDLPRGRYTFQVKAIDRDLNYSAQPATVSVTIHPPYERIAWIASLSLTLILIAWQAVRIVSRDRKVLLANRELQQKTADLESANQALQTTQSQLVQAEKMSTLGMLAGGVAHELNNPLQTLLAGVRRILRYPDDVERHRQSADLMEQAARHSSTIVQNLLSYTRKPSPELASVDLNEAVASTIALLHHHLGQDAIEVVVERADLPPIDGNFNELCTVVTNLAMNARDAVLVQLAGEEATRPRIEVATAVAPNGVSLTVRDNGPGIAAALRERIFDPFYTTKEVGSGTGLGLSIVRGIVERHGGRIEVASEERQGTTFSVHLPAKSSG